MQNNNKNEKTTKRRKDRDGLYKRREWWHYELVIDGRKRSFTTGTKDYKEAKAIRAEAVRDVRAGKRPSDTGRKKFESTADEYIVHRQTTVSAGTVRLEKERLRALKKVIGNVTLEAITTSRIKSYQSFRAAQVSNRTVNLETKLLRAILQHEGQWSRLEQDYKRLHESGDSPGRALTPDESLRLFTLAESRDGWLVAYLAATVANDTGMRGVELRNLRLSDVKLDGRKISINRSKGTKGGIRTVVLTSDAVNAAIKLVQRAKVLGACDPGHYLFPYKIRRAKGYDPTKNARSWRGGWRALTIAAGLKGFRFHDLRHTFITEHAEIGTPFATVMAQSGHLSRRMTELYTHISTRSLENAAQQFEARKVALRADAAKRLSLAGVLPDTAKLPDSVHLSVHNVPTDTL